MAFFTKRNSNVYADALEAIQAGLTAGKFGDAEIAGAVANLVSLESIDENTETKLAGAETGIEAVFKKAAIEELLYKAAGWSGLETESKAPYQNAVNQAQLAMTTMAMAANSTGAWNQQFMNPRNASNDFTVIGSEQHSETIAVESFDSFEFDEFKANSILSAGLTMATSPFQAVFRPVVVPASQSGLDMLVTVPQVYNRAFRPKSGESWELRRESIVEAALDHTILEANQTKIVPVASAENASVLVDTADVVDITVKVGSLDVAARPIKYGQDVNLINISSHAGIEASGAQTEMDTLDPMVSIGEQFIKITNTTGTPVSGTIKVDVGSMPGALLNAMAEGRQPDKSTYFEGVVWVSGSDKLYHSATPGTVESTLGLAALAGLAGGSDYRIKLHIKASARVQHNDANLRVDIIDVKFGDMVSGASNAPVDASDADDVATGTTLTGVGYWPVARRSNSNMRDLGTVVDTGTVQKFRLAVPMEAPISSVKPITQLGAGVSLDTLTAAKRLRNMGSAGSAIMDIERRLIATDGLENAYTAIGAVLVKPTYVARKVTLSARVKSIQSSHNLADVQHSIVNAVSNLANELLMKSNYRNALRVYTNNANNFSVDCITDSHIGSMIMTNGDGRTLGNNRRFTVTETDDLRFRGKVYVTFSRTDVAGADPLNFACHLSAPSLIYKATTTKGGAVAGETQMVPREAFYVTLPILGRLDVVGLEGYFHDA